MLKTLKTCPFEETYSLKDITKTYHRNRRSSLRNFKRFTNGNILGDEIFACVPAKHDNRVTDLAPTLPFLHPNSSYINHFEDNPYLRTFLRIRLLEVITSPSRSLIDTLSNDKKVRVLFCDLRGQSIFDVLQAIQL